MAASDNRFEDEFTIVDYIWDSKYYCRLCMDLPLYYDAEDLEPFDRIYIHNDGSVLTFRQRNDVWWTCCLECKGFVHINCIQPPLTVAQVQQMNPFQCCKRTHS